MLVAERKVTLDPEAAREIDDLLLRGSA
jgi:hypothetical protein